MSSMTPHWLNPSAKPRLRGVSQLFLARDERHQSERVRLLAKMGAQVGTVIAIQLVFLTRIGRLSTNVGCEPK